MFFQNIPFLSSILNSSLMTIALWLMMSFSSVTAKPPQNQTIKGTTGGNKNSGDCGYIANKPNYVINLSKPTYSLNIILDAQQGKPSLLILGPTSNDRFCVLGEPNSGKNAQMGGFWQAGKYSIYVGDAPGNRKPFTLKIINE